MPWKLAGPCIRPGCPELAIRAGRCATHQSQAPQRQYDAYDAQRASPSARGYDYAWLVYSRKYLKEHPTCEKCGRTSVLTDHIVPMIQGGDKWWSGNHQALCKRCHNLKTAQETRTRD